MATMVSSFLPQYLPYAAAGFVLNAARLIYRHIATRPQASQQVPASIAAAYSAEELALLTASASELSRRLRSGATTSTALVQLFTAHIKRVNPYINAVVLPRFEEAAAEAVAADRTLAAWRRQRRPNSDDSDNSLPWLTGVPCTIKENFDLVGMPSTSGHPGRARKGRLATRDAPVVARLRAAGAIVLGKTNLSEMCMWMEASNSVYGLTRNPFDVCRTAGGSSGGEAAASAAGFGAFGLGADIGGSIRMPAAFNGVLGFKPSTRLVPNAGQVPGCTGDGTFLLVTGPMCRHAEDLYPLLRTCAEGGALLEDPQRFPPCPPLRAQLPAAAGGRVLPIRRVYAVADAHMPGVRVSADVREAVRVAADALAAACGPQCAVVWVDTRLASATERTSSSSPSTAAASSRPCCPPGWGDMRNALQLWSAVIALEPTSFAQHMGLSAPFAPTLELLKWLVGVSQHTLPAIGLCLVEFLQAAVPGQAAVRRRGQALQAAVDAALRDDGSGDASLLVLPTYPTVAPGHNVPLRWPISYQYSCLINLLQLPSVATPVWPSQRQENRELPCGVQIAAAWGRDDLAAAGAMAVEAALGGYQPPPFLRSKRA